MYCLDGCILVLKFWHSDPAQNWARFFILEKGVHHKITAEIEWFRLITDSFIFSGTDRKIDLQTDKK